MSKQILLIKSTKNVGHHRPQKLHIANFLRREKPELDFSLLYAIVVCFWAKVFMMKELAN